MNGIIYIIGLIVVIARPCPSRLEIAEEDLAAWFQAAAAVPCIAF